MTTATDRLLLQKAFSNGEQDQLIYRTNSNTKNHHGSTSSSWRDLARQLTGNEQIDKHNNQHPSCYPRISDWDKSNVSLINPLTSNLDYSLCNYCGRPYLNSAMYLHYPSCPKSPKNMGTADITGQTNGDLQTTTPSVNNNKKRKLDKLNNDNDDDNSSPKSNKRTNSINKKDRKAEKPAKRDKAKQAPKPKAPVDVEKQCGVPLQQGGLCARSLTCKTHSMGAKRAVAGRSAPYDVLLAQYQRKNQVKMASLSTAQQLADENEALGGTTPINPEEEVAQVMEGVRRANPLPLERKVVFPSRLKNQFFRMREMLASALLPKGAPTTTGIGGILGRANAFNPDTPEDLHFIRPPSLQRTAYLQAMKQQQHQQRLAQLQQQQQQQQQQRQQSPGTGSNYNNSPGPSGNNNHIA